MFSLHQTSVLIIPLGQFSDYYKLISLIPLGGSLEVTPLAVKLLDNRLYILEVHCTEDTEFVNADIKVIIKELSNKD